MLTFARMLFTRTTGTSRTSSAPSCTTQVHTHPLASPSFVPSFALLPRGEGGTPPLECGSAKALSRPLGMPLCFSAHHPPIPAHAPQPRLHPQQCSTVSSYPLYLHNLQSRKTFLVGPQRPAQTTQPPLESTHNMFNPPTIFRITTCTSPVANFSPPHVHHAKDSVPLSALRICALSSFPAFTFQPSNVRQARNLPTFKRFNVPICSSNPGLSLGYPPGAVSAPSAPLCPPC